MNGRRDLCQLTDHRAVGLHAADVACGLCDKPRLSDQSGEDKSHLNWDCSSFILHMGAIIELKLLPLKDTAPHQHN